MRELHAEPHHEHRVTDPTARPYDPSPIVDDRGRTPQLHWSEVLDWRDCVDLTEAHPLPVKVTKVDR